MGLKCASKQGDRCHVFGKGTDVTALSGGMIRCHWLQAECELEWGMAGSWETCPRCPFQSGIDAVDRD